MEEAELHTTSPRPLNIGDVKRFLEGVPPVRTGVTEGSDAYHHLLSSVHGRPYGEFELVPAAPEAPPTAWALVPNAALVEDAIATGQVSELIALWDELSQTAPWSTLAAAYGAAHEYRPGGAVEAHHRAEAASGGFDIVAAGRAHRIRSRLLAASEPNGCVDLEI